MIQQKHLNIALISVSVLVPAYFFYRLLKKKTVLEVNQESLD